MNTTHIGKQAESIAADWLAQQGYAIVAMNWRTRWCEIDIVATKGRVVYFTEVRYRKSSSWGDGVDSITFKKQQQIEFAANFWLHQHNWPGDARLCVIACAGDPAKVINYLEL